MTNPSSPNWVWTYPHWTLYLPLDRRPVAKSTLTKQYTHHVTTEFLAGICTSVSLLVTVIELAQTFKASGHKAMETTCSPRA